MRATAVPRSSFQSLVAWGQRKSSWFLDLVPHALSGAGGGVRVRPGCPMGSPTPRLQHPSSFGTQQIPAFTCSLSHAVSGPEDSTNDCDGVGDGQPRFYRKACSALDVLLTKGRVLEANKPRPWYFHVFDQLWEPWSPPSHVPMLGFG